VELGDSIISGVSGLNAGTVLFTVADLGSLIVRVNLNEVDIAKVRPGQPVNINLDAYPQRGFQGRVRFVAPAAEPVDKVKVFKLEIAVDDLADCFRTGMSANVEILGERRENALSVPLEALQRRDNRTVVYRLRREIPPRAMAAAREGLAGRSKAVWLADHWQDYFEPVPVEAGLATLERAEIRSGLSADDQVCLEDPTRKRVEKDEDEF
jgi:multidrug efflux pump subunit AcrA (membrane-fusion protein)